MARHARSFYTLDRDLARITHAEAAQLYAIRPVWRLGVAVLLLVAGLILAIGLSGGDSRLVAPGAGLIVAGWLGLSIGANDIANSLGPAVGAGAVRLVPGLVLVALAGIAGASLAGEAVAQRLASGIVDVAWTSGGGGAGAAQGQMVMLSALIGAAVWITIATGANLPVSTSHSVVGAIAGAGCAAFGAASVDWRGMLVIASAWMMTPLIAAALAGSLLVLLQSRVGEAPDRARAARRWLPALTGAMIGLFTANIVSILPAAAMPLPWALLPGAAAGLAFGWLTRRRVEAALAIHGEGRPGMKLVLRAPLLMAAAMMGFAHGAGDAGNVAGPLLVILAPGPQDALHVPWPVLAGAGAMIGLGALLFGRRLVHMVAGGITRLNATRAFCITLSTALIVLAAAGLGLPVSSTHTAIGGVFGVGFAREMLDRRRHRRHGRRRGALPGAEHRRRLLIRRSHVATITVAWMATVPLTALIAALAFVLIDRAV